MDSMRDSDRFWWALLLIGLGFCVAVIADLWYLLTQDLQNASFLTPDAYTFDIGMDVFTTGQICLGLAAIFLAMATRARDRHQKRAAALRGDLSDMPLATIQPDPDQAPDVSAQPLEVLWRMSDSTAMVSWVLAVPLALIGFIGVVGPFLYFGIAPIFVPSMRSHPLSPSDIAVSFAVIVGMGWYASRIAPTLFGYPFGVRATPEGVESRTADSGARSFIAWDEVRLFEVMGPHGAALRSFALYAPGKAVIWRDYRAGRGEEYAPVGATASENALRQAALLNLITARTGLEPRTLARALRRDFIGVPGSSQEVGALALAVFFALCLGGLAIGEYLFPITPYAWANWLSVAALSLLGLYLTVLAVMAAAHRHRGVAPSEPPSVAAPSELPSVAAPSLDSPGSVYSLRWRVPTVPTARLVSVTVGGLLLVVNLVPAVIVAPQAFTVDADVWHVAMGCATGMLGLAGVIIALTPVVVFGERSMSGSIRADTAGLTRGDGPRTKLIPWSMMREIIWRPRGLGGYPSYVMLTDNPLEAITWPASSRYLAAAAPSDGAMPIGADELAVLVADRIGRPIRVVE